MLEELVGAGTAPRPTTQNNSPSTGLLTADRAVRLIELSTVVFYSGDAPKQMALSNCSFPMPESPQGAFCALYGVQGKQDGFVGARAYAEQKKLRFTVIDLLVDVERQNPLPMKSEDLAHFDFLNFKRMSKALGREVSEWLSEGLEAADNVNPRAASLVAEELSMNALAQRPALLDLLLERPELQHLRVIACPAMTSVSGKALNVGNVPHRHWNSIKEASCRLDPTIRITLDPPSSLSTGAKRSRKPA